MKLHKPRLGLIMKSMFFTSKTINKAIILLIVSICIWAQFASASHTHSDIENSPEPSVCVMCLASNQDDDGNLDIPPSLPTPFVIPNTLDFDLALKSGATLAHLSNDVNVIEPPNLRPSTPRAPPV